MYKGKNLLVISAILFSIITILIGATVANNHAEAMSFHKLPIKQNSQLWTVELGEGKAQFTKQKKPKEITFSVYSLDIRSKSDAASEIHNVEIEVFRNQPNTHIQYELFSKNAHKNVRNHEMIMHHHIFPVPSESNEIEVTISWFKKGEHKRYKETFVFTKNNSQ